MTAVPSSEPHPGTRLREVRELRGVSVRGLAEAAGVSASFLSQFERGLSDASVGNLRKLAQALGMNTADLFDDGPLPNRTLLLSKDRRLISADLGTVKHLVSAPLSQAVEVYTGEIVPGGVSAEVPYAHGSTTEIVLVTSGRISYELDGGRFDMAAGDSIEHSTSIPHRLSNNSEETANVVWIIAPPSSAAH